MKSEILNRAIKKGIITKLEYNTCYKGKYLDHHGIDSFTFYLDAALNGQADFFITNNKKMLRDKDLLEQNFKLRIRRPDEAMY